MLIYRLSARKPDLTYEKNSVAFGEKKTFYLIANGMPVNFCRKGSISLTNRMIDLIFAEMTLCAESIIKCPTMQGCDGVLYMIPRKRCIKLCAPTLYLRSRI